MSGSALQVHGRPVLRIETLFQEEQPTSNFRGRALTHYESTLHLAYFPGFPRYCTLTALSLIAFISVTAYEQSCIGRSPDDRCQAGFIEFSKWATISLTLGFALMTLYRAEQEYHYLQGEILSSVESSPVEV